jgi:glycerol-3-phosphate acyltransferase PlsY
MVTKIFLATIFAYLLGSVSSAIIICKLFRLPDPRACGSNNPGTTNVLRIGGKLPAILTLFGDVLKGFIAVLIAKQINILSIGIATVMVSVFFGHLYPAFFRFRGGKGVATALGVLLAFSWQLGLLLIVVWIGVVVISKISSLGAIIASLIAICCGWWAFDPVYSWAITIISSFLLFRHKQNIMRLFNRQEPKIGKLPV